MKTISSAPATSIGLSLILAFSLGCASPQGGDVSRCEQEKAQLLATIRQQREEVNTLRDQTASLERRLAESETEIARLDPTRQARGPIAKPAASDLPWRSPAEVAGDKDEGAARR